MRDRRLWWLAVCSLWLTAAGPGSSLAETVMAQLAALPSRSAGFVEEKRLGSLSVPLVRRGRLGFTRAAGGAPARLEQDTESPTPERLVIEGDRLRVTGAADGASRDIALDEHPALRALADTLRAALAGDLVTLRGLYAIEEQGSPQAWRLLLVPRAPALRRMLARVTLDGFGADIRQISIQQGNGDEQRLTLQAR